MEKGSDYWKKYYSKNRKKLILRSKMWKIKNRERFNNGTRERYWARRDELRPNRIFKAINQRCYNKNHKNYKSYGGRGIRNFLTFDDLISLWKRDKAEKLKSPCIDRIDNDGDYTLQNCQFIERSENTKKQWNQTLRKMKTWSRKKKPKLV